MSGLSPLLRAPDAAELIAHEAAFTYSDLFAIDADGALLPAWMEIEGSDLSLAVDVSRAAWPVTVDPLIRTLRQVVRPTYSLSQDFDVAPHLGRSVAVDGASALVGAPDDGVGASVSVGSVYVLSETEDGWEIVDKLLHPEPSDNDAFGVSVALHGNIAAVGANGGSRVPGGRTYVFERDESGRWQFVQRLQVPLAVFEDNQAGALALSGRNLFVSAAGASVGGVACGLVYRFTRNEETGVWSHVQTLEPSRTDGEWGFGRDLSSSASRIAIGASSGGRVHIFHGTDEAADWTLSGVVEQGELMPEDAAFGRSVSLDGDTLAVGAFGDQPLGSVSFYEFSEDEADWTLADSVSDPDGAGGQFGDAVVLDGDVAWIAERSDPESTAGSIRVLLRSDDGTWRAGPKLEPALGDRALAFGAPIAATERGILATDIRQTELRVTSRSIVEYTFVDGDVSERSRLGEARVREAEWGTSVAVQGRRAIAGANGPIGSGGLLLLERDDADVWNIAEDVWPAEDPLESVAGAVALDGDRVMVRVVQGFFGDGRVFVLERDDLSGNWTRTAILTSSNSAPRRSFGVAIALDGDVAVIGAEAERSPSGSGGVGYIFERTVDGDWEERAAIPWAGTETARLGRSVALVDDTAIVGASGASAGGVAAVGEVREWRRDPETGEWADQGGITSDDPPLVRRFGESVAFDGEIVIVGAPADSRLDHQAGAAFAFVRSDEDDSWRQVATFLPPLPVASAGFGSHVALDGATVVISELESAHRASNAYVFDLDRRTFDWTLVETLSGDRAPEVDHFGTALSVSDGHILVGAPMEPGEAPFGDPYAGALYFYRVEDRFADGDACVHAAECASGFCVDGVCCDSACGGSASDCSVCALALGAAADGVCTATTGNPCNDGVACTTDDRCTAGECLGGDSPCSGSTTCEDVGGAAVCSSCPAGTSSPDGTGIDPCVPCATGTWSRAGAAVCAGWTECSPGQRVSIAGSSVMDQVCEACPDGTATTEPNSQSCTPCAAGTYAGSERTACIECPDGEWSVARASACRPWSVCEPEEYEVVSPSPVVDRTCAALRTCSDDEFEATPPSATADRVCSPVRVCAENEYEASAPSPTSDRLCETITECTESEFEIAPPTATSDRQCAPLSRCSTDEFERTPPTPTSDRECVAVTACGGSEYQAEPPTRASDRVCAPVRSCASGEYESAPPSATSDRSCEPCTACPEGTVVGTDCGASNDTVCAPAPGSQESGCAVASRTGDRSARWAVVLLALAWLRRTRRRRTTTICHPPA